MITASALKAHCGYIQVLSKARKPTPAQQASLDIGTRFHALVERWVRDGEPPVTDELEVQGWLDLLASQWAPAPGTKTELAWGLTPDGLYAMVEEVAPHVYRSPNGVELLTAGRNDVCWLAPYPGGHIVSVVDWKTGKWPVTPARENLQVNAAGIALMERFGVAAYMPGIYYARDGVFDWGEPFERNSVLHLEALVAVQEAAILDETPRPGSWCASCWERRSCYASIGE